MKLTQLLIILCCITGLHSSVKGQALYWDANDSTPGSGTSPVGTWGTDSFWSSDSTGSSAVSSWVDGSSAIFSAGNDASGSYTVTVSGTQTASSISFEDGNTTVSGGNLTLSAPAVLDVASGRSATISSVIGGTAGLTKTNAGTLTISANNTYSGSVIVSGGTLVIPGETSATGGAANPLGAAPAAATPGSLVLSNNATLRSTKAGVGSSFVVPNRGISLGTGGGQFEITDTTAGNYLTYGGIIAGSGTLTKKGNGTYYPTGINTYTGNTTNLAGTIRIPTGTANIFGSPSATLVMAGGNFILPFDATRSIGNRVRLTADTTISGNPTNSFRALSFTNGNITTTAGTLTIRNAGGGIQNFQVRFTGGGFTFSRPIVIGQAGDNPAQLDFFTDVPTTDQTFSGLVSGPGSVRRTCNGDGTGGRTIMSGANTYTGGTFLNGGHLGAGSDSTGYPVTAGPFGTGSISVGDDANDGFFASGGARSFGNDIAFGTGTKFTVSGTNNLTMYGSLDLGTSAKTLYISNTALTTISGTIIGSGSGTTLTKQGPGVLAVSGNNTYGGDTLVGNGTLFVNSSTGSGTSSGTVTVNAGATLGGSGTIAGPVTVSGALSPGAGTVGRLTVQNGINLSSSTSFIWELGALKDDSNGISGIDYDQLEVVGGAAVIDGSASLTLSFVNAASAPASSNSFWLTNHSWTIVGITGSGSNPGGTKFPTIVNGTYPTGYFTNTVDVNGDVFLNYIATFVAPPAPTVSSTIAGAGTANATISWSSVNGANYQVQYKNDLNAPSWTPLGNVTASGATASFNDTTGPTTNRFYRVVVP